MFEVSCSSPNRARSQSEIGTVCQHPCQPVSRRAKQPEKYRSFERKISAFLDAIKRRTCTSHVSVDYHCILKTKRHTGAILGASSSSSRVSSISTIGPSPCQPRRLACFSRPLQGPRRLPLLLLAHGLSLPPSCADDRAYLLGSRQARFETRKSGAEAEARGAEVALACASFASESWQSDSETEACFILLSSRPPATHDATTIDRRIEICRL